MTPPSEQEPHITLGLNQPAPPAPTPSVEGLQFGKAEFESAADARKCTACAAAIPATYYQLHGQVVCPNCASAFESSQRKPGMGHVARGILYGIGAAIAGAVIYAAISLATGYMIGFITVFIGWLVGTAVRKGSAGLGGRRCQIVAVMLAYVSMTAGYIPDLVKGFSERSDKEKAAAKSGKDAKDAPAKAEEPRPPITFGGLLLALLFVFGIALISPFLMLASGFGGLINAFLLFIGMKQAWTLTATDPRILLGPYEPEPAAGQPA